MGFGGSRLIERYIARAIVPYLVLSLLLLTMILFVQQASRFAELLLATQVPLTLLTEVVVSIFPNVLAFTMPMAMLAGTMIGFGRMSSDSELIAMRAAGASNLKILRPVLLTGLLLSICAAYINLELAPGSAQALRRAGLQAALHRLDSPVEPKTFNTEIPGYVVYVRDGDKAQGRWERVFIYSQEKSGAARLITARSGRIDAAAEQSELVLSDAVATTIPPKTDAGGQYITERLAQLRIVLETGRKGLLERLRRDEPAPEEMGLRGLLEYAKSHKGSKEGREAATLLHRRLSLSLAPLIFALLGGSLSLHFRRGGKGWGSLLSLIVLLAYYMLSLLGEQLARKGTVEPIIGSWAATFVAAIISSILLLPNILSWISTVKKQPAAQKLTAEETSEAVSGQNPRRERPRLLSFPSLLDLSLLRSLAINCSFAYVTLIAIFLIFTSFELWRFITPAKEGLSLLARYLLFLLPLATVQLLSASLLIAVLMTYALLARRSEAIAWWAGGQSVYRLLVPGIFFSLLIGLTIWLVQEKVLPQANLKQDALRSQIRGGVARAMTRVGRQWLASASTKHGRLYAYELDEEQGSLIEPAIYEFDAEGVHLSRIISGKQGIWQGEGSIEVREAKVIELDRALTGQQDSESRIIEGAEPSDAFKLKLNKPAHLSSGELSDYIKTVRPSGRNVTPLLMALQRKYAEPHTAWIMALFGIPLALAFGRRSAVAALSSAVAIGLAYWGVTGIFQQLGEYGLLSPTVAAWSPLLLFAALGVYLLTRMRT